MVPIIKKEKDKILCFECDGEGTITKEDGSIVPCIECKGTGYLTIIKTK
jgi:DnaJ-class molecular chaperone